MQQQLNEMILPLDVIKISELYKNANKKLYVVGGAVRDFLQSKTPKDFDLATDALPEDSIKILNSHFKTLDVGKAFGVIIACPTDKKEDQIEIATFRIDNSSGRRPDSVTFTTIENDVKRRDLTVNALFYDIEKKEIVDLVNGKFDLAHGIVRTVGNPVERFEEDRLRKLRAIRFVQKLENGALHIDTYNALMKDPSLLDVSPERIRDEFLKILIAAKDKQKAVDLLAELHFFSEIFPGLNVRTNLVSENPIVTIALMLRENPVDILAKKMVLELKYESPEASAIIFLNRLQNLSISNAYTLKKIQERSSLNGKTEEILEFSSLKRMDRSMAFLLPTKLSETFAKYEITTSGTILKEEGFIGAEIGKEMQRIETEKFRKLSI